MSDEQIMIERTRIKDRTGQRHGMLVVQSFAGKNQHGQARRNVLCDCGRSHVSLGKSLSTGEAKSCGCKERQTHGLSKTPEYGVWRNMISRCTNPKTRHYDNYGGRGIRVCERWMASFEAFYADVGPRPSALHSIDRRDVDGNYEPSNVRWATKKEQQQNLRKNVNITHNGVTLCLREWARRTGIHRNTLDRRIACGWSGDHLFSPPSQKYKGVGRG